MILFLALLGTLVVAMVRAWHRPWWGFRPLRVGLLTLVSLAPVGFLCRWFGVGAAVKGFNSPTLSAIGAGLGGGAAVMILALLLTLPLAGLVRGVIAIARGRARKKAASLRAAAGDAVSGGASSAPPASAPPSASAGAGAKLPGDSSQGLTRPPHAHDSPHGPFIHVRRRQLLEGAVGALPATALGLGGVGVVGGFTGARVIERPMRFAGLAPELAGLRIAQLTDLHLGAFMTLDGLRAITRQLRDAKPDLIVLTGDISDHLPWLPGALDEVNALAPRLGAFAVMGNHEYFRGAREVRRAYAEKGIPMLDDRHVRLPASPGGLVLLGVDDPVGSDDGGEHYARRADKALSSSPSDADLRVALCHRPSGFRDLAARGVDLTLSGHTHGGQIGVGERSVFEPLAPAAHLWGRYEEEGRQLYTSSGGGQWAAFRLACPSEVPLIVLERA